MKREEAEKVIIAEGEKLGFNMNLFNAFLVQEVYQASFDQTGNWRGVQMFVAWYGDKFFRLLVWPNGRKKLEVDKDIIMG